jgi:hypothetical protein
MNKVENWKAALLQGAEQLSGAGRLGIALLALHIVLLFLPPIPPDLRAVMPPGGSLWSYLIGYTAVILLLIELRRSSITVVEKWQRTPPLRRWLTGAVVVAVTLTGSLALWVIAPERFARFSGEEGLWEPLTLFCYLASAALLADVGQRHARIAERRPVQLLAGLYLLLALEEIDYFGIFGAFFGRIDGVYAGTLHDILRLVAEGVIGAAALVVIATISLLVVVFLWRTGFLSPKAVSRVLRTREFLWVVLGFGFLAVAAVQDAALFGWGSQPPLEEALELLGAICLTVFALETAARELPRVRESDPGTVRQEVAY